MVRGLEALLRESKVRIARVVEPKRHNGTKPRSAISSLVTTDPTRVLGVYGAGFRKSAIVFVEPTPSGFWVYAPLLTYPAQTGPVGVFQMVVVFVLGAERAAQGHFNSGSRPQWEVGGYSNV